MYVKAKFKSIFILDVPPQKRQNSPNEVAFSTQLTHQLTGLGHHAAVIFNKVSTFIFTIDKCYQLNTVELKGNIKKS